MKLIIYLLIVTSFQFMTLFNFNSESNLNNWYVVDDGVMGGKSQGNFSINNEGHGEFSGDVSLKNNGGFSSIRYNFDKKQVSQYSRFVIRLKGDGKNYQFRSKSSSRQRYSYIGEFTTSGEWQVIEVEFSSMYPAFRGYKLNQANYSGENLSEIAFLIGNKKEEFFKLELDYIKLK